MSALERTLGVALFVRDYQGMHATAAGTLFVRSARLIMAQLSMLVEETGGPASPPATTYSAQWRPQVQHSERKSAYEQAA